MIRNCMECGKECSGQRCMDCFKKTQVFRVGNLEFANKRELDLIIKQQIKEAPRNIEFSSEFFRTIINELHEDVKRRNFKVTKFKILDWYGQVGKWEFCRDRFRGGVFVLGFFEPINEWHGVTLYPHKREKDNIKKKLIDSLRQKWSEHAKKRDKDAVCQNCGNPFPHLHHDNISFNEIALNCLEFFSEQELEKGIGDDWWLHENEADAIPNDHPAVLEMLKLHKEVKYKWLCSKCHYKEHNGY